MSFSSQLDLSLRHFQDYSFTEAIHLALRNTTVATTGENVWKSPSSDYESPCGRDPPCPKSQVQVLSSDMQSPIGPADLGSQNTLMCVSDNRRPGEPQVPLDSSGGQKTDGVKGTQTEEKEQLPKCAPTTTPKKKSLCGSLQVAMGSYRVSPSLQRKVGSRQTSSPPTARAEDQSVDEEESSRATLTRIRAAFCSPSSSPLPSTSIGLPGVHTSLDSDTLSPVPPNKASSLDGSLQENSGARALIRRGISQFKLSPVNKTCSPPATLSASTGAPLDQTDKILMSRVSFPLDYPRRRLRSLRKRLIKWHGHRRTGLPFPPLPSTSAPAAAATTATTVEPQTKPKPAS